VMIAGELAEAAHVFVAIDALEGVVGFGDAGYGIGEGEADFLAAVVEGEDFGGGGIGDWGHKVSIA